MDSVSRTTGIQAASDLCEQEEPSLCGNRGTASDTNNNIQSVAIASVRVSSPAQQVSQEQIGDLASAARSNSPSPESLSKMVSSVVESISPSLKIISTINNRLMDIRSNLISLSRKTDLGEGASLNSKTQKALIIKEHENLMEQKLSIVQKSYVNEVEGVLAMAIPVTIKEGTYCSSAGSIAKIFNILSKGIIFDESVPATGTHAGANFSENEMGNRGVYFSEGKVPVYIGDDLPLGIQCNTISCSVDRDVQGIAIMPAPQLHSKGFSKDAICEAYDKLQRSNVFLMHDDLPPAETELVFMKNQGVLQLNCLVDKTGNEISLADAVDWDIIDEQKMEEIKKSWKL